MTDLAEKTGTQDGPIDLDVLARKVRKGICSSYSSVLIGNAPPVTREYAKRMMNPQVGDLVAETTTNGRLGGSDLNAVGILEEITREPVDFGDDPDFVWDEAVEGMPHPDEKIVYIRTFDGRRLRWSNAHFVAAVEEREQ